MFDCKVILLSRSGNPVYTNYSAIHNAFNHTNTLEYSTDLDLENYVGWIYVEELKWEMVKAYETLR